MRLRRAVGACAVGVAAIAASGAEDRGRTIAWADVAPLQARLASHGLTAASFAARLAEIRRTNVRRVREGDLDHLVFYVLQSTRFSTLPPIEPALSAKAHRDSGRIPDDVRARAAAFVTALDSGSSRDARLAFFRELVASSFPDRSGRRDALLREYERAMRFVYEKEFVAQRSANPSDAVADLYRKRGLSTDTAVEAGYVVYQGLGVLKGLEPARHVRRVLIVGPGLDLAPRTGLVESDAPQSYQPWAVIDALLALKLAAPADLAVVAVDINPRVVVHLRRSQQNPPTLTLASGIQDSRGLTLAPDYQEYLARLGTAIGDADAGGRDRHRRVRVRAEAARLLHPGHLDIVTERLDGAPFDLVIATNILPYFDEVALMLAMSNVSAMLAPGGVMLHNEPRESLGEITSALGLRFEQLRQAVIARAEGAPKPLADVVFIHRKP